MWISLALTVIGALVAIAGIALLSIPAAIIVSGIAVCAAGLLREDR